MRVLRRMRSRARLAICALLALHSLAIAAPLAAAGSDAVLGAWTDGRSIVTVSRAGAGISMHLTALQDAHYRPGESSGPVGATRRDDRNPDASLARRPLAGIELLREATWRDGAWHGQLYDPDGGQVWRARLHVDDAGVLQVRGHVGITLLGRTVVFHRVTACTASIRAMRIASGLADCRPCPAVR